MTSALGTPSKAIKRKPIAIDLFAGCGGLTEGLKQAGFRVVGAIEIDELAAKSYRMNHPRVRLWNNDIRTIRLPTLRKTLCLKSGELDLLAGCPPCQGFSNIRTLNGNRYVRDRRNSLTDEFLRFVKDLRPRAIMLENVPGLANKRRFREFAATLESMGYNVKWDILDAALYGVPQRRRRLILLASKSGSIDFAPIDTTRMTVADAIGEIEPPHISNDPLHCLIGRRSHRISELIKRIPKDGGSRSDLPEEMWLECHKKCSGFKDVYGRMRWSDVAPTITGGCLNPSKGRFLHPDQNRALTVREAALLQGFPPGYRFATDRGMYAIAGMIGNALPPEFIRRHAIQIAAVLKENRVRTSRKRQE
ncbi:MAG: DNA cytosine methyltransferase [Phycisphaeraceae bacterium]|nr:MAG: DNA cytosine methyltransferase [Phycisphaeraceae bacterium]